MQLTSIPSFGYDLSKCQLCQQQKIRLTFEVMVIVKPWNPNADQSNSNRTGSIWRPSLPWAYPRVTPKKCVYLPNPNFTQRLFQALFCTGNESVEAAVSYVFSNLLQDDNEEPVVVRTGTLAELSQEDYGKHYKMSCVVNTSLKMGVGKTAAQVFVYI